MPKLRKLRIATAQFPVSRHLARNLDYMVKLTQRAKRRRADVVHFSETCLGGYVGSEFDSWDGYDWSLLRQLEDEVPRLAKRLGIHIVYGTNHRVATDDVRNALWYVSAKGERVARYDKRFCTTGDLDHYRSGKRFTTFDINGFRCGLIICHDFRYPELFRAYKKRGVQIVLASFYNARAAGRGIHSVICKPSLQGDAASNHLYISANNSSGYYQSWPSMFILPDGTVPSAAPQHRTALLVNEISSTDEYYDAAAAFRDRAMRGVLYSE